MNMTFGEKVRNLRKSKRLSQKELSSISKIPFFTIVSIELGRSRIPQITTVIKYAKVFNMSIDKLLKGVVFN